jgi:hypothetical protein
MKNEPYFKKKIHSIPIESTSHIIDQSHPVLLQVFDLDNLQIREEDYDHEIEATN